MSCFAASLSCLLLGMLQMSILFIYLFSMPAPECPTCLQEDEKPDNFDMSDMQNLQQFGGGE